MREGDRVAILRPVQNVQVGDVIRGLDPDDYDEWVTVTANDPHVTEYVMSYKIVPGLGMFVFHDKDELVEVQPTD